MSEEQRRRTRVGVHLEAQLQIRGQERRLETENLSLNGLLCRPDQTLAKGDRGSLRIALSPEAVITAQVEVVRSDAAGVAIGFTEIDPEGFVHLRRLVQYNTEDADLIDQELHLAGFSRHGG